MPDEIVANDAESPSVISDEKKKFRLWHGQSMPLDLVPLVVLFVVVVVVILFANDWKLWDGQRGLEETNDAYVRADVTPLSTKVAGTVARVLINDFDTVKAGQLLVELRNDDFTAQESQAHSTYLQSLAAIDSAQKQIEVQSKMIENARLTLEVSKQEVPRTRSQTGAAAATVLSAGDAIKAAGAEKQAAEAKLQADQAVELRALQERHRQEDLFADAASTQQTVEQVVADHERAKALVAADKQEIQRLTSAVRERSADTDRQQKELAASHSRDLQSQLLVGASSALLLAENSKLDVLSEKLREAKLDAAAKLQAWNQTKVALDYTKIRAPIAGTLSERRVRAGQQVNAGTQVITIVSSVPWVIASFRETQMRHVKVGDRAQISVDALGGETLEGTVQSLSPASEAQFALLPPDNPSGNFTKITQRIPVKITFPNKSEDDHKKLARIKSGMTVIAKVWTR
ncbi:MAG: HlyD family secretion protein [Cyanobacteria bacterium REEB67]|nr:HlyD family secretion protein [Cyanobacteria bacterium REEB67]